MSNQSFGTSASTMAEETVGLVEETTREFNIEQQTERGYFGAFREPFAGEIAAEMMEEEETIARKPFNREHDMTKHVLSLDL